MKSGRVVSKSIFCLLEFCIGKMSAVAMTIRSLDVTTSIVGPHATLQMFASDAGVDVIGIKRLSNVRMDKAGRLAKDATTTRSMSLHTFVAGEFS